MSGSYNPSVGRSTPVREKFIRSVQVALPLLPFIAILCFLAFGHAPSHRLDGWWVRGSSDGGRWPEQVSIVSSEDTVWKKYWADGHYTETLKIDGRPHVDSHTDSWMNFVFRNTYSARLQNARVTLAMKTERIPANKTPQDPGWTYESFEIWSVSSDGKLHIASPGSPDLVYTRPSIWYRLFHAEP
jgi:hypothetical protein